MLNVHMRSAAAAVASSVVWTAIIGGVTAVRRRATYGGKARR